MNVRTLSILIAVSLGSSTVFATTTDWMSDTAQGEINAEVINPLVVSPPENGNNGALGRVKTNSVSVAQLDFLINATDGYTLDLVASVQEDNSKCHDPKDMGVNGTVKLDTKNPTFVVVTTNDTFIQPVKYTYTAPSGPNAAAVCMVNLAANYQ
ncbi:hypothetical protein ACFFUS_12240 [Vibrio gallaecicus]|uniref:hypothetical protein n=1 Tax=Vibrio gallaecicus TaxID=552386 RepID=UPI0010C97606|nr:hypothetical protein [Vibrio gallaecicus]MDN3617565.1 hypothetical protein [Vibrio gallaecicus]